MGTDVLVTLVYCAKMSELIKMLFGRGETRMGPLKSVLDGYIWAPSSEYD